MSLELLLVITFGVYMCSGWYTAYLLLFCVSWIVGRVVLGLVCFGLLYLGFWVGVYGFFVLRRCFVGFIIVMCLLMILSGF